MIKWLCVCTRCTGSSWEIFWPENTTNALINTPARSLATQTLPNIHPAAYLGRCSHSRWMYWSSAHRWCSLSSSELKLRRYGVIAFNSFSTVLSLEGFVNVALKEKCRANAHSDIWQEELTLPSFMAFMMIFSSPVACSSSVGIPVNQTMSCYVCQRQRGQEKSHDVVETLKGFAEEMTRKYNVGRCVENARSCVVCYVCTILLSFFATIRVLGLRFTFIKKNLTHSKRNARALGLLVNNYFDQIDDDFQCHTPAECRHGYTLKQSFNFTYSVLC